MTTIAEKMIPTIKEAYLKHKQRTEQTITFEEEMEELVTNSFMATFGTASCSYSPKKEDLERWGKTIEEIATFFRNEGFYVDISKGKHLSIYHLSLREIILKD